MPAAPCTWKPYQEAILLSVLKKAKDAGQQAESGWKSGTFEAVVDALDGTEAESGGSKKQLNQVKSRWQKFKSEYSIVKKLRNASGFGWDAERGCVTASKDVWDAYIKAHEKAQKFKKQPFPFYDEVAELVDGVIADGRGAFRPGRTKEGEESQEQTQTAASVSAPVPPSLVSPSGGNVEKDGSETSDISDSDVEETRQKNTNAKGQQSLTASKAPITPSAKKGRQSGAAAIFALSESIESVANSFNATTQGSSSSLISLTSPQRRTSAIEAIEENEELSDDEMVNVADLIRKNTDIADTYLALKKPSLRSAYLKKHLNELV